MATLVTDKGKPYIEDVWDMDDFRNVAMNNEWDVTDSQLLDAMEHVVENFDANYGITWDTVEMAIAREIGDE